MHVITRPLALSCAALLVGGVVVHGPPTTPVASIPVPPSVVVTAVELAALPTWLQWVNAGTAALTAQIAAIAGGLENELDDPVPIISALLRNQVINVQDVGGALITSAQVLTTGLVSVPQVLLNAVFDIIANPLNIPAVITGIFATVINTANAAITPVTAALTSLATTTFTRAVGVFNAVLANAGAIGGALINVPIAIGTAAVNAALGVVGSVVTLNPLNVIDAVGDGLVSIETTAFNSVAAVSATAGTLRQAVRTAVSFPLPAAAVRAVRPASASATVASPSAAQLDSSVSVEQPRAERSVHAVPEPGAAATPKPAAAQRSGPAPERTKAAASRQSRS
jgi:hypothetical protein